jgi:hypothetical protein
MLYEVVYQLRGEKFPGRVALANTTEAKARRFCRNLANFPAGTIHYAITCDDGRTVYDTRKDGLL